MRAQLTRLATTTAVAVGLVLGSAIPASAAPSDGGGLVNGLVSQVQSGLVNVGLNNVLSQDQIDALANVHQLLSGILNHIGIL
ncbi:hypothetical protein ACIBL5_34100 [Streptomyces sp. NPDC050516]|uniref:hypothetical protein n=1 Tax=Streptomyces sp. NPDC050516 TaxID=3365621 RepID=UPI0037879788